jgi:penicillin-binding protein 1C
VNIKLNKNIVKKIILGIIGLFLIYLLIPLPSPLLEENYSLIVNDEDGDYLRVFLNDDEQWCFPPSDSVRVPDKLQKAVICFEDNYFYWHPGVNPVSVMRASYQNISNGRIVSGASTITMQVARMVEKKPRTFFNKFLEMFLALKIEFYYSKEEILKIYLDHVPFGGNIKGYRAAAEKYFEKTPSELSWAEAAALAVLPNSPGIVNLSSGKDILKQKRDRLLKKLHENGEIDESAFKLALLEPIISRVYPFRITAPHLTQVIKDKTAEGTYVNTTINKNIQLYVELIAKEQSRSLKREGIRNCAALIMETQTGKIKAYVGSQDYFDADAQGMVNGVTASRSSGSILKPFLYALSMDEGIIIPQTLIKDVRSYFDAFTPQNADEKFSGILPAKEALIRSLNIPAVRLLNTYGIYRFYSFLKNAGVSTLFRPADDYGLPLIIGGAEVNMMDMAMMYGGLANSGMFSKPYYLKEDSSSSGASTSQLISPGACLLVLDMLKELKRPGAEYYWEQYQNQRPIAWKTGTSYGGKDAWAVGVSPEWTIAVWAGNFDGDSNPNLSGAASAGPLLFEIFNYLPHDPRAKWFDIVGYEFNEGTICNQTGFLAGPYCDDKVAADLPSHMYPLRLCPFHKNVFVDESAEYSVCSRCWEEGYREKHYTVYPADVVYHLKQRGHLVEDLPAHNPACAQMANINQLEFLYPVNSTKIWLPKDYDGDYEKIVSRIAHKKPASSVFWYLDDTYLGITKDKHEMAISIDNGWHNLSVIDQEGHEDKIKFYVTTANR